MATFSGVVENGSRSCERKSGEVMMTGVELLKEVLQGVLLIVGEYRGTYTEMAGYVVVLKP